MATERIPTDRIIQALRETNGLVSLAAKRVPCSITTINVRRKRVQAVEQVIQECRGELVDLGELALRKAVLSGEPWAVGLVLKTLGKERGYSERHETDITSGGKPLQPPVSDDGFNRALSTLADAIRETLPGEGAESGGTVGSAE